MKPLLKDPERQKMYEHIIGMFIVTWLLLIALFVFGCKDKAEAKANEISDPVDITIETNDYDELVIVVQELQKMVGILIDTGNVQINCLGSLTNIGTSLLKRIEILEKPNEHKPDTTKLVGGIKKIAELIEYYHER